MIHVYVENIQEFTVYLGKRGRAVYIGFYFLLHKGWCSNYGVRLNGWQIKGGWEYYQSALLLGRQGANHTSRWIVSPTIYLPARIVNLWRMRKASWRKAMREDAKLQLPNDKVKE